MSAIAQTASAAPADRCQADASCRKNMTAATQLASQTRYEEAITLYEKGYEQSQEPRLLLNIGRCHYRLGRPRQALQRYEEFRIAQPNPDPEVASRLNQFIAEAKLALVNLEQEEARAAAAANEVEPPPAPLLEHADGKTVFGRPLWRVGAGLGAVALGGLFIGIGAGALAANGRCITPSTAQDGQCASQIDPDGTRSTVVLDGNGPGIPLLVTGVVLFAGGALLVALPSRASKIALFHPSGLRTGLASAFITP